MNLYGIGLGLYPEGISDIFSKCLWAPDIKYFNKALSSMIKNENIFPSDFTLKFENDYKRMSLIEEIKNIIDKISKEHIYHKINDELYDYLDKHQVHLETLNEIMNKDPLLEHLSDNNLINSNISMYKKGIFKNLKILICCFWSKSIAPELEGDEIDPKYLKERFTNNKPCLADVISMSDYGIKKEDIKVVCDYENGIKEMCKGIYYATWIICGNGEGKLPNGETLI